MGTGTDFRASWNATFSVNIIDSSPLVPFKSSPLDTLKNKQVNLRHIYKGSPNSYQHGYKISKIL
ncbi:hypothetical protein KAM398_13810 [Acinetobacter sp. KAM398]|nr:hypothetical protein KAM392_12270 [Acinetobacter sp. KAM392]GJC34132.1 hypothetical protein KAM393_13010 [Acinetobacter sp. KAM393]GJC36960.1 hypothetical protein KAM394_13000 [Acinetobacter sp. KAM394]GJC39705.1 hypothetical protein KAM395_12260 [Acinetobacter sp. KAM395]GJC42762.1 hypothetical protein KAM396_14590 [Acinetobacter sp. KAM396]GJC45387.1 hypothetical protein KAM397_12670 [Acinetobacter sp. KAM397]GJC48329.1 hypothetical protein KAM398_13810 [Acinetobacter sp. KAM398]GJC5125